jgi:peptide/nickel transport system ATP-binding protein
VLENPQHPYTRKLMSAVPLPDPERRRARQKLLSDEVPSPVRPASYVPPARLYREVSPGHVVQDWADALAGSAA